MATPSDRLTIVLTLKDRVAFTHRWMRYMHDRRCPYPIVIADGGSDAGVATYLADQSRYPALRYSYVRYPADATYAMYYDKLADAIARVSTPYVVLADNDDFLEIDSLATFTQFLDGHAASVSCGGRRRVLRLLDDSGALVAAPTAARYEARVDERPKTVVGDGPADRMCFFLHNVQRLYLWSSWYSVHRTPALLAAAGYARTHEFRDPVAHELHVHLALLLHGGYHQLAVPSLVIQAGSSQLTAALEAQGNLVERFIATNAIEDVHRSIQSFGDRLSADDRDRVIAAVARWFSGQAAGRPAAPSRAWQPLRNLLRRTTTPTPVRLPALEPYILGP